MKADVKRKNYYLDEMKIRMAQKILGTKTETATIDQALDLVVFRKKIRRSLKKAAKSGDIVRVF